MLDRTPAQGHVPDPEKGSLRKSDLVEREGAEVDPIRLRLLHQSDTIIINISPTGDEFYQIKMFNQMNT